MSQSAQSVTDLNRMFYNALLMICWFGAIPLSCMSSPQVQSCDSLMKRLWWKLWDNIIFGGVPYRALRLVHDPAGETWPGLWFTAVQLEACANSSLSAVWGTFCASLLDIILCLQMNITACWLSVSSPFMFDVTARWKGPERLQVMQKLLWTQSWKVLCTSSHVTLQRKLQSEKDSKSAYKKITANMLLLKKDAVTFWGPISVILLKLESYLPSFIKSAVVSKISQFPQFQGQLQKKKSYDLLMWLTGIS